MPETRDWQAEYVSEKKRADAAEEREQQLIDVMRGILDYTNTAQAYTTAAQIHYRIRNAIRTIYGADGA